MLQLKIPRAATMSPHAATKDPVCRNEDPVQQKLKKKKKAAKWGPWGFQESTEATTVPICMRAESFQTHPAFRTLLAVS